MEGPVLVTGAAGFVGSHLLDLLHPLGLRVEGWMRPATPPFVDVDRGLAEWKTVELLDPASVLEAIGALRPRTIIHLAGAAHVGQSWSASAATLEANVIGTHHVLEADRRLGLGARILVTCSGTIYAPSSAPMAEDAAIHPDSPYAVSKLAQEQLARRAAAEGQHVVATRSFNHIGPRQDPAFAASSFARQVALAELGTAPAVLRVGNLAPARDLTDVRDTVRAYAALIERGVAGRAYNVCSGRALRMQELVDGLVALATVPIDVHVDPALFRPHDAPSLVGDPSRLTADTGWTPAIPLGQTLQDLLDFWRERVRWR